MNDTDKQGGVLVYLMRGLPCSGKSTKAKELSESASAPIVSRDAIRLAVHGQPYIESAEPLVDTFKRYAILSLVYAGHRTIIVDECNVDRFKAKKYISNIFKSTKIKLRIVDVVVDTSKEECIKRAGACGQDYLVPVIEKMWENWRN